MLKKNVFLVSYRRRNAEGRLYGEIQEEVVCSVDEAATRAFFATLRPDTGIVVASSLEKIEERAKKIRNALAGIETGWTVTVDPAL